MTPVGIWEQVHKGLRAFILKRVRNDGEADDILQEVFFRVHRRLDGLKDPERMVSWLFQITRHVIIDFARSVERRREVSAGLAVDMEETDPGETGSNYSVGPNGRGILKGGAIMMTVALIDAMLYGES